MTNTSPTPAPAPTDSPQVRLPGIAIGMFIVAPVLMLLGWLIVMGSGYADYFERAATQATLGTVVFFTGVVLLVAALVLEGVRGIAQRQLDLLRADRR